MITCKYGHDLSDPANVYHHGPRVRCRICKLSSQMINHRRKTSINTQHHVTLEPERFREWALRRWQELDEQTRDAIRALA